MASMVKKFRLAWISVSWLWMEGKHYFSKYMNPYAHTHLHALRPWYCNRICLCVGLCPSRVVLNTNQAHLTALVTQHFGKAATHVIQANSSVVQTKPGNGPSIVANKVKLIELFCRDSVHIQVSVFSLVGENVVCTPHCKARCASNTVPAAMLS